MQKQIIAVVVAGLAAFSVGACRNRCNYDNALTPHIPERSRVKLLLQDSSTGANLLGAGRRYHPDSIFFSFGSGSSYIEKAQRETLDADTAISIYHTGTMDGADCKGNPWPRRVGHIDSVFLRLNAVDTDTLVVSAYPNENIVLHYNGRLAMTTAYADNATQTLVVRK